MTEYYLFMIFISYLIFQQEVSFLPEHDRKHEWIWLASLLWFLTLPIFFISKLLK